MVNMGSSVMAAMLARFGAFLLQKSYKFQVTTKIKKSLKCCGCIIKFWEIDRGRAIVKYNTAKFCALFPIIS